MVCKTLGLSRNKFGNHVRRSTYPDGNLPKLNSGLSPGVCLPPTWSDQQEGDTSAGLVLAGGLQRQLTKRVSDLGRHGLCGHWRSGLSIMSLPCGHIIRPEWNIKGKNLAESWVPSFTCLTRTWLNDINNEFLVSHFQSVYPDLLFWFLVITSCNNIWNKFWKIMIWIFYAVFYFLYFNLHIEGTVSSMNHRFNFLFGCVGW